MRRPPPSRGDLAGSPLFLLPIMPVALEHFWIFLTARMFPPKCTTVVWFHPPKGIGSNFRGRGATPNTTYVREKRRIPGPEK